MVKVKDLTEKVIGDAADEFVINDVTNGNLDRKLGADGIRIITSQITDYPTATVTLSNRTFSAPKFADLGFIADANGNEILTFDTVTAAVNEIKISNSPTGSFPIIMPSNSVGSDTNCGLIFSGKGTGRVNIADGTDPTKGIKFDPNSGITGTVTTLKFSQTVSRTITFPDATDTLIGKSTTDILINKTIDGDLNTLSNIFIFLVAANDANAAKKEMADYVCDGTSDDVEIQAALNALPVIGGTVILTEGTYSISNTINLVNKSTLMGSGRQTTLLTAINALNLPAISLTTLSNCNISKLSIDGNKTNQTTGSSCITVTSGSQNYFKEVELYNGWDCGILVQNCPECVFTSCIFRDNGGSGKGGNSHGLMLYSGSHKAKLISCHAKDNYNFGLCTSLFGAVSDYSEYIGCIGIGNGLENLWMGGGKGHRIIGCHSEGSLRDAGITFDRVTDSVMSGNTCVGNNFAGLLIAGSTHVSVSANISKNNGKNGGTWGGIYILKFLGIESTDITVMGNVCYDDQGTKTQKYGMVLDANAQNNYIIAGNDFQGNLIGAILDQTTGTPIKQIFGNVPISVNTIQKANYDALLIGDGTAVLNNDLVQIVRTFNAASSGHGYEDRTSFSPTATDMAYASYDTLATSIGAQNMNHLAGFESRMTHASSGTLGLLTGFMSFNPTNNGGLITDLVHFFIPTDAIGSGAITNQYGLKIVNLAKATNNWAIYTGLGKVHFGDALDTTSSILSSSSTAGIGYSTGAGGTVTQTTSRTTGVTINKICGTITTDNTSLAAFANATFTVTNSTVAATDTIILSIKSGPTNPTTWVAVSAVASGSFNITIYNLHLSAADVGAAVINFSVIKSVAV